MVSEGLWRFWWRLRAIGLGRTLWDFPDNKLFNTCADLSMIDMSFSALASQFATSLLLLKTKLDARSANTTTLASIPFAMMLVDHRSCLRSKLFDSKLLREKCVFQGRPEQRCPPFVFEARANKVGACRDYPPNTRECSMRSPRLLL